MHIREQIHCVAGSVGHAFSGSELGVGAHKGINRVVKLFEFLDDDFIKGWMAHADSGATTPLWVRKKYEQFQQDGLEAEDDDTHLSMAERADLVITRLWLTTLLWRRVGVSNGIIYKIEDYTYKAETDAHNDDRPDEEACREGLARSTQIFRCSISS